MDIIKLSIFVILLAFSGVAFSANKVPKLFYTQTIVGSTLVTKISTVSGTPLPVALNTVNGKLLTPYVGITYNSTTKAYYYSYFVDIDVGAGVKSRFNYKTKISTNSLSDMVVDLYVNPISVSSYFNILLDFFITNAYAINPLAVIAVTEVVGKIIDAARLAMDLGVFGSKTGTGDDYCENNVLPKGSAYFGYGQQAGWWDVPCCKSKINLQCQSAIPSNIEIKWSPITKGKGSDRVNDTIVSSGTGLIGKALGVVDLVKNVYDMYKSITGGSPSSYDPGGGISAPSDKDNYQSPSGSDAPTVEPLAKTDHDVTGDLTKDLGTKTDMNPDGSKIQTKKSLDTQFDGDTIISKLTSIVSKLDALGNIISALTSSSAPDLPPQQSQPVDLCVTNPTILACLQPGVSAKPDVIPSVEIPVSMDVVPSSPGSCPAGIALNLSFGQKTFSYAPVCQAASLIKPFMIVLAYLSAGFILYGSVRE